MKIKQLLDEDFCNYKLASMFIGFPTCTFKCEKDCGKKICQNSALATAPDVEISTDEIVKRYTANNLTSAIVCGGLEPFDSFDDLISLISEFRNYTDNDIVIYTGYYAPEILDKLCDISQFKNIVIKFGRYIPGQKPHFDDVLGVDLGCDNQYAKCISK